VYHKTMCDYICIVHRVSTGSTIASSAMVGKRKSADVSIVHCGEGFAWNITAEKWDKEGGFTPWCWAIEMIRHPVLGHIYYRHVQTDSKGVETSPPPWSVVRFKPEIGSISNGMVDDLPGKDDCKKVTRGIIAGPEGDTFLRNVAGCWTEAFQDTPAIRHTGGQKLKPTGLINTPGFLVGLASLMVVPGHTGLQCIMPEHWHHAGKDKSLAMAASGLGN
jgi:hypothetical protein